MVVGAVGKTRTIEWKGEQKKHTQKRMSCSRLGLTCPARMHLGPLQMQKFPGLVVLGAATSISMADLPKILLVELYFMRALHFALARHTVMTNVLVLCNKYLFHVTAPGTLLRELCPPLSCHDPNLSPVGYLVSFQPVKPGVNSLPVRCRRSLCSSFLPSFLSIDYAVC